MTTPRLCSMVSILHQKLSEKGVAHALIGAMALALYGIPRYTADIDLLSDECKRGEIVHLMGTLGFDCFQDTGAFAQFDSAFGVYGKVDFMFVHTDEGRAILDRAAFVRDEVLGEIPVVQPTDYAILKLMAIANNPDRKNRDTADLETLFNAFAAGFMDLGFKPIDVAQLRIFADRFGVSDRLEALLPLLDFR